MTFPVCIAKDLLEISETAQKFNIQSGIFYNFYVFLKQSDGFSGESSCKKKRGKHNG